MENNFNYHKKEFYKLMITRTLVWFKGDTKKAAIHLNISHDLLLRIKDGK